MPEVLPSGLPADVADNEDLARFIYQSNQCNSTGAKPAAFLPPSNGQLSVARHPATPLEALKKLAASYRTDKNAYGGAMITVKLVRKQNLDVEAIEPPARHANIIGWPTHNDPDEQKSLQLLKAKALADASQMVRF